MVYERFTPLPAVLLHHDVFLFVSCRYTIEVEIFDNGANPLTATATVTIYVKDINDNTPFMIGAPYVANVMENAPLRTFVVQVYNHDM